MPLSVTEAAAKLRQLANELDGGAVTVPTVVITDHAAPGELVLEDNWVRVHPPYTRTAPGYRDYPNPHVVSYKDPADGLMKEVDTIGGYASSIQEFWHCNNFDFRSQGGRLNLLGDHDDRLIRQRGPAAFPGILDNIAFILDYLDDATYAKVKADQALAGTANDPYISHPPAPQGGEDVPIPEEK